MSNYKSVLIDAYLGGNLGSSLLKEGGRPGAEHRRLEAELKRWAEQNGYREPLDGWADGTKPDVLHQDGDGCLFVGDAKDAKHETPSNSETRGRIENYVHQFARQLRAGCDGGVIAIATNGKDAAYEWVDALNQLAREAGITAPRRAHPTPDFVVETVDTRTFIVWW